MKGIIDPRIVKFTYFNKMIYRLFHKNHHIGVYDPRLEKWIVKFPYNHLINIEKVFPHSILMENSHNISDQDN